ncbi:MAG: hypothetical protein ACFFD2_14515 [Promethearchaeota archaeon]
MINDYQQAVANEGNRNLFGYYVTAPLELEQLRLYRSDYEESWISSF